MLNMLPTNDRKLLGSMSFKIFSSPFEGDIGYIFYEDDKPIGFAKLVVGDTSIISAIGILPDYRGKGYGDFFTRSILFRLTQISRKIVVNYIDDYYLKFGFIPKDNIMEIESYKLTFNEKNHHC